MHRDSVTRARTCHHVRTALACPHCDDSRSSPPSTRVRSRHELDGTRAATRLEATEALGTTSAHRTTRRSARRASTSRSDAYGDLGQPRQGPHMILLSLPGRTSNDGTISGGGSTTRRCTSSAGTNPTARPDARNRAFSSWRLATSSGGIFCHHGARFCHSPPPNGRSPIESSVRVARCRTACGTVRQPAAAGLQGCRRSTGIVGSWSRPTRSTTPS